MKKVFCVVMMFVVVMMVSAAIAEPANNRSDAMDILEKYAKDNGMTWWIEDHYDAETETRFSLLTASNEYLLEEYGIDFGESTIDEFIEAYKGLYDKYYPEAHAVIKVAPVDVVNDTIIYELMVATDIDMEPDYEGSTKCGRALFVVY